MGRKLKFVGDDSYNKYIQGVHKNLYKERIIKKNNMKELEVTFKAVKKDGRLIIPVSSEDWSIDHLNGVILLVESSVVHAKNCKEKSSEHTICPL